jgi:hypothetical protein
MVKWHPVCLPSLSGQFSKGLFFHSTSCNSEASFVLEHTLLDKESSILLQVGLS